MGSAVEQAPGLWRTDLQRHAAALATSVVEKGRPFLVVVD